MSAIDAFRGEPWLTWTVVLVVVLPLLTILLSEVHLRLVRRRSPLARIVNRLRLWLIPTAALLVLLVAAAQLPRDNTGVRLVATAVGLIAVSVALGGLNAVLFDSAREGTWRQRLPSIFVDLGRLVLVLAGAAMVASLVWGFDVGGLVAALGVGSLVIGLALQGAVGSVVSGLLLLFEQPFEIGDTLEVGGVTGRVVEVNWRSTHLDIGGGEQIIPNAVIATSAFANLSRPTPALDVTVETSFGADDAPHDVMASLLGVARDLPQIRPGAQPAVRATGSGTYATTLPLQLATQAADARSLFVTWLWYAARREGLALDGAAPATATSDDVAAAVRDMTPALSLTDEEVEAVAARARIEEYARGEAVIREGDHPTELGYVLEGVVRLVVSRGLGETAEVAQLTRGEVIGETVTLREAAGATGLAASTVRVLRIPGDVVTSIVASKPVAGRRLGQVVSIRRTQVRDALAEAGARQRV